MGEVAHEKVLRLLLVGFIGAGDGGDGGQPDTPVITAGLGYYHFRSMGGSNIPTQHPGHPPY